MARFIITAPVAVEEGVEVLVVAVVGVLLADLLLEAREGPRLVAWEGPRLVARADPRLVIAAAAVAEEEAAVVVVVVVAEEAVVPVQVERLLELPKPIAQTLVV